MQIVPLTGKRKLVAQVVVASCATCATTNHYAQQQLVPLTQSGCAKVVPFYCIEGKKIISGFR